MVLKSGEQENFIIKQLKNKEDVKEIQHKINMRLNFETLFNIIRIYQEEKK